MVVRELVALFGVKSDQASFKRAEGGIDRLAGAAKAAMTAFAGLAITRFVKQTIDEVTTLADRYDKMSERTGVASVALQAFGHATELSGTSIEDLETSIRKLQVAQSDAAFGLETYTREFDRLGVSIRDEEGNFKDTVELLLEISDGMKGLESDTERTAVATKLLGRSGTALIPMLKNGSGAVREMMQEMEDLGGIIDRDLQQASVDFVDNQRRMTVALFGMKMAIGRELLPMLIAGQEATIKWWKANRQWIKERIGPIFKTIGQAVRAVVKVVSNLVWWFAQFFGNLPDGVKKILGLAAAVGGLWKLFGVWGVVIAAVLGTIEDLMVWMEGGNSLIGSWIERLSELIGVPVDEFIKDVLKWIKRLAEDPVAALLELSGYFEAFGEEIKIFFSNLWQSIADLFQEKVVDRIKNLFSNLWSGLTEDIPSVFRSMFERGIKGELVGRAPEVVKARTPGQTSVINAPNTSVNIDVKATPGMNEERLASETTRQFKHELDKQNRAAMRALKPARAGA